MVELGKSGGSREGRKEEKRAVVEAEKREKRKKNFIFSYKKVHFFYFMQIHLLMRKTAGQ